MVSIKKKELIGSPHKIFIRGNLFDFMKKRENINLCGSKKSVLKPFLIFAGALITTATIGLPVFTS